MITILKRIKFYNFLPYIIIFICLTAMMFDRPNTSLNTNVLEEYVQNQVQGVGEVLSDRIVVSLETSQLLMMRQSDIEFQTRKSVYIVLITMNIFIILRKDIKHTQRLVSAESKGLGELVLCLNGDKECKVD